MTRRDFFRTLAAWFGLIALPILPGPAAAQPRRLIQRCWLAGFQCHEGPALWSYLTVGDSLELVREPDNHHDRDAFRVNWLGSKLGYISRSESQAADHLMRQGHRLETRIGALRRSSNPWQRVQVEVWLVG